MKYFVVSFLLIINALCVAQTKIITGIVKDIKTKQILPYCNVSLLNINKGTHTGHNGEFSIEITSTIREPKIVISYIGYQTDTIEIIDSKSDYILFLKSSEEKLNEVVVTGVSKATLIKENPVSIISVSSKALDKSIESNIIDALVKNVPGLNAVKTGPNISKPFIRGLGYNRVLTLYDGIRQEGQQWGDEHGIEVDGYNMQRVEVIKGPSSLMYGSDALAGVVSLIPYIPNEKDSIVKGRFLSEYQSNNGLIGNGLRLGFSSAHWLWAVRGNYRIAKNYSNSIDGRVYNTGFQEANTSGLIGYTSRKGYTHLNFTLYDNFQGIPDGSRDSLTRKFTKQLYEANLDDIKNREMASDAELNSYQLSPLHQHIQHYRVYSNNHYQIGKGEINATIGFQKNIRREYNHPTEPKQAGLYVTLNTINYSLQYNAPRFLNIETTIGTNGMYQNNASKNATDFPIPNYNLIDIGVYLYAKWKCNKWTIGAGVRYDTRMLSSANLYLNTNPINGFTIQSNANDLNSVLQFPAFNKTFTGTSISAGSTYQITSVIGIKFNIAKGYRAPSITEYASNGLDPGAHIIYLGNKNFVPELSLQEDIGIISNFKDLTASISIFNNSIQHYIYLSQLVDAQGNPINIAQGNKIFQYQQAEAQLYGAEIFLGIHPSILKGFSINNNFSWIYGFNAKQEYKGTGINGEYLPFIPPIKLVSTINQDIKINHKILSAINLKLEVDFNAAQNRYLALYETETPTAGYTLFNASFGMDINYSKKQILQLQCQVNNLFDLAYQSNLSRLKYFEYYSKTPKNTPGIYGMGRNICFKLILPF